MPSSPDLSSARGAGQLRHAWLSSVRFEINDDYDLAGVPPQLRYHLSYDHGVAIDEVEERLAVVRITLSVGWHDDDHDELDAGYPFDLELGVGGLFEWDRPEPNREIFEAWLEWNGVYLLWPYIRSYVSAITAASPHEPLTLYTLRVPDPPDPKAVETAETAEAVTTAATSPKPARKRGGSGTTAATGKPRPSRRKSS